MRLQSHLLYTDNIHNIIFRSVHNVRIERLWVDVSVQVRDAWAAFFQHLEIHYGLDVNNRSHIWLLHTLFLPLLNQDLTFFAESWNEHRLQIKGEPRRSPADLFVFDSLVHGVRGDHLDLDEMSPEELEVYGIDWAGLRNEQILASRDQNNDQSEDWTSWVGQSGPPPHLNQVTVDPSVAPVTSDDIQFINNAASPWINQPDDESRCLAWCYALNAARQLHPYEF
jgi:hypothetical protein